MLFLAGTYSLSVRDWDDIKQDHVKHYRIRNLDNGGFYITARRTFHTLPDLVKHYSGKSPFFLLVGMVPYFSFSHVKMVGDGVGLLIFVVLLSK